MKCGKSLALTTSNGFLLLSVIPVGLVAVALPPGTCKSVEYLPEETFRKLDRGNKGLFSRRVCETCYEFIWKKEWENKGQ